MFDFFLNNGVFAGVDDANRSNPAWNFLFYIPYVGLIILFYCYNYFQ